jgi:hypothetical protein
MEFPWLHEEYKKALPSFEKWRDGCAGEEAMKAKREKYLPRLFEQDAEEYEQYLEGAAYYNAPGKTVDAMVGSHFRKEPTIVLPAELEKLKDKVSHDRALRDLLWETARELWKVGRLGILAEFENGEPRLYLYRAEDIVNWHEEDGRLLFVILRECYSVREGYKTETREQYRILELGEGGYHQRVFRWKKADAAAGIEKGAWTEEPSLTVAPTDGERSLDFIPFSLVNFEGSGAAVGSSPVSDLCALARRHFKGTADLEHTLHLTACPFLLIEGMPKADQPEKFRVGSSTVLYLPIGGDAKYVVASSEGVAAQQRNLEVKEDQMARMGGGFLRPQKKDAETAESMRLQQTGESAVLIQAAAAVSKGLTQALQHLARWIRLKKPEAASVSLSLEFFDIKIEAWEADFLFKLYLNGELGLEQLFEGLQGGGILKKEWLQTLLKEARSRIAKKERERNDEPKKDPEGSSGGAPGEPV